MERKLLKKIIVSTFARKCGRVKAGRRGAVSLLFFTIIIFLIGAQLRQVVHSPSGPGQKNLAQKGRISISGAWALYPLMVLWVEEYRKENPSHSFDLQAGGAGKGMAEVLAGLVDIGMVSREIYPEELGRGALPLAVARDAVVGTVNSNNPLLPTILKKGISSELLKAAYLEGTVRFWEELVGLPGKTPINLYTRSDACGAAETWAAFLGGHQEDLKGIAIFGDPGLVEAVRRDPLALGFNNLNFAFNPKTTKPHEGLVILPLDLNRNGQLETEENFYQDRNQLMAAISAGLYPSPPARKLYLVVKKTYLRPEVLSFLSWVLEKGQNFNEKAGYLPLDPETVTEEKQKLKLAGGLE